MTAYWKSKCCVCDEYQFDTRTHHFSIYIKETSKNQWDIETYAICFMCEPDRIKALSIVTCIHSLKIL